jgi:hypothetical protein
MLWPQFRANSLIALDAVRRTGRHGQFGQTVSAS